LKTALFHIELGAGRLFCSFPGMTVEKIDYGAGTKSFPDHPNILRVVIGE